MIAGWQRVQRERALSAGVPLAKDPYLIAPDHDHASSMPWRPDVATQLFGRLRRKAGLDGIRLHDVRHAAASFLLAMGFDPVTVGKRLGHDPRTLLSVYGHVVEGRDREAANMLAARFGS